MTYKVSSGTLSLYSLLHQVLFFAVLFSVATNAGDAEYCNRWCCSVLVWNTHELFKNSWQINVLIWKITSITTETFYLDVSVSIRGSRQKKLAQFFFQSLLPNHSSSANSASIFFAVLQTLTAPESTKGNAIVITCSRKLACCHVFGSEATSNSRKKRSSKETTCWWQTNTGCVTSWFSDTRQLNASIFKYHKTGVFYASWPRNLALNHTIFLHITSREISRRNMILCAINLAKIGLHK